MEEVCCCPPITCSHFKSNFIHPRSWTPDSLTRSHSHPSGGGGAQVYLVVRPDGHFELGQDSLHLQVPLCCINRRLQDLVRLGGCFCFLSEK